MNENIWWLILSGLISGVFGGMGMGGGTLLIPILTIFLSFPQKTAQALNLFVFIPMAIVSLIVHIKNKLVDFKVGVPVIISGTVFSVGGSILAGSVSNEILRKIFGCFLLCVGVYQGAQAFVTFKKQKDIDKSNFKISFFIK